LKSLAETESTAQRNAGGGPLEVMVPLRDGCHLATDVYGIGENLPARPVILERTPYGKRESRDSDQSRHDSPVPLPHEIAAFLVDRGYIVVRQDCRGRGNSEGSFVKYLNEGPDGADSIAWIRSQPWCNGQIAMMGVSYSAHVQTAAAAETPPGLTAMFMDSGGFSSAYEAGMRMGGAFELKQATWAFRHAVASPEAEQDSVTAAGLGRTSIADWFKSTPWRTGNSPLSVLPEYERYLLDQWAAEDFGDYWKQPGIYGRGNYDNFPDVPSLHISSWYDPYIASAIENFSELRTRKMSPSYLVLGPWTHGKRCRTYSGDADFGSEAHFDGNVAESYQDFRADWFDEVLHTHVKSADRSPVTYFLMGGGSGNRTPQGRIDHGGRWTKDIVWPPAAAVAETLFLGPNGTLSNESVRQSARITYQFDPANPVPTIGGQVTSGEPVMSGGAYDQTTNSGVFGASEPYLPLSARADVLVFRTEPLTHDKAVAGPVSVELYASSSAPDTDFTIKLIDEYPPNAAYPNGYAMNLTEGILRARFRNSFDSPEPMTPDRIYKIRITAPDTANLFAKGHRIRVDVSSSNFPRFDINPNTGGPTATERCKIVAENTVHMSRDHPSAIHVMLIPEM
jgi:putative CocE/NonD family hydrolase